MRCCSSQSRPCRPPRPEPPGAGARRPRAVARPCRCDQRPDPLGQARPAGQDRPVVEESPEVIGQLPRRGVATLGLLRHRLADDRLEVARDRRVELPRRWRLDVSDLAEQLLPIGAVEGRPRREQLVEGRPQRVDVGPRVEDPPAGRLFGTHVAQGAEQVAAEREVAGTLEAGQAEVGDPEMAAAVDQQVAGLDVTMQDAQPMRVLQGLGRLHRQSGRRAARTGLPGVGGEAWSVG